MTDIIKLAREAEQSAIKTLEQLGYTYHGGELWKPPLGKAPEFNLIDSLRADAERLDWLNLAGNHYAFHISGTWYSRKDYGGPFSKHKTIRAAIDAARAKEQAP